MPILFVCIYYTRTHVLGQGFNKMVGLQMTLTIVKYIHGFPPHIVRYTPMVTNSPRASLESHVGGHARCGQTACAWLLNPAMLTVNYNRL